MNNKISNISNFIKKGEKHHQLLGLEVEHFILDGNNKSVFYSYENGKTGVREILDELSEFYDKKIFEDFNGKKYLIGLKRKDCEISIEPGAQFEVSISACESIKEIQTIYEKFLVEVNEVLSAHNYHLANIGYRPDACALEVPIIPKMRYICMDANFKNVGTQGFCMMRCSAATQISIDYSNEKDCIAKMKVANALSPIIYFLLDNSQIFERCKVGSEKTSPGGMQIPKRMARWNIWNNADPDRCTSNPNIFDKSFNYEEYAKIISSMDEVYTPKNLKDDTEKVKHELSMNFFDVRLKNTIEIRPADSMPTEYTFAYVELIKNLFYNSDALKKLWDLFKDVTYEDYKQAGEALQNDGWNANVYGQNIFDLLKQILSFAQISEAKYLNPIIKLVEEKKCLKDFLNENYEETPGTYSPKSSTSQNTEIQSKCFDECADDFEKFVNFRKNSKVSYMNKISKTGYFSKVFDLNNQIQFEMICKKTSTIVEKVCHEYFTNPEFKNLFTWDKFEERLINFLPRYSTYAPIVRFDVFFDDATGQFEFCEFNTGGSAAMSKVTYACEEIQNTRPYKKLKQSLNSKNKDLKIFDVYTPWVKEFKSIYKQWCKNTKTKFDENFNIAICDFLDDCQLPDFGPFKNCFEKNGMNCIICDIRDLKFDGKNLLSKDNEVINAIYKRVTLDDLSKQKNNDGVNAMIDSVLSEKVCSIDWFSSQIVHDKQLFPILHMPQALKLMTESEKSFIELHIPESYILDESNFSDLKFIHAKNEYLIKPISSRDAKDVFVGKELTLDEWKKALSDCSKKGNFIIQKFCKMRLSDNVWVNPNDIDVTLEQTVKQCCNMEGLYCYNSMFGGLYLRQQIFGHKASDFDMTVPVFYETE